MYQYQHTEKSAAKVPVTIPGKLESNCTKRNTQTIIHSADSNVIQLFPNMFTQYMRRLKKFIPLPAPTAANVDAFIRLPANATVVGINIQAAYIAAAPLPPATIPALNAILSPIVLATQAAPGQYQNDTAFNQTLTTTLLLNPFIQSVMAGIPHNAVGTARNSPLPPAPLAVQANRAAVQDDLIDETVDLFTQLNQPIPATAGLGPAPLAHLPNGLPAFTVNQTHQPHAAMNTHGTLSYGFAATRGSLLHEFGHHVENNLGPADYLTLLNFMRARTRALPPGAPVTPMSGMRDSGYFFEHHNGNDLEQPRIYAGGTQGRPAPTNIPSRIWHALTTPFYGLAQTGRMLMNATPLRYAGLLLAGLVQQPMRLLGRIFGTRRVRRVGDRMVDNFFVYNSNNNLRYNAVNHHFGTRGNPQGNGTTEYLSTTMEFFNQPAHVRELVRRDPLRVCLYLYLVRKADYEDVRANFAAIPIAPGAAPLPDLNDLIHAVR